MLRHNPIKLLVVEMVEEPDSFAPLHLTLRHVAVTRDTPELLNKGLILITHSIWHKTFKDSNDFYNTPIQEAFDSSVYPDIKLSF